MNTFESRKLTMEYSNYAENYWKGLQQRNEETFESFAKGRTVSGLFLMPPQSEKEYCKERRNASVLRKIATSMSAYDNDYSMFAVDGYDNISWVPEGGSIPVLDGVDSFTKYTIGNHKLATILRVHDDTIADSQFDLEGYLVKRFAKSFAKAEDNAFINGTGSEMPTGILNSTGGAEVGITTGSLTYDDVIRLFFSVDPDYRGNGVWLMNDATALVLRTMKDENGNHLWNHANDTILSKPVYICNAMPDIGVGEKPIAFGDFSYYWIVDREPISIRSIRELYQRYQQTGYLATEYMDAKLIRPEAIKVIKIADTEE